MGLRHPQGLSHLEIVKRLDDLRRLEIILAVTSEVFRDLCHNQGEGGRRCGVPNHYPIQWQGHTNPPVADFGNPRE